MRMCKMRATNDRLAEKYLVIVARELGKALKGLHAAGIIHRDVKGELACLQSEAGIYTDIYLSSQLQMC